MSFLISTRSVELEAVLREPHLRKPRAAAILCHPHPQYGGTMDNRVVFRAGKAAMEAGLAALRFNFRGVGASTGSFDHGDGEKDDVGGVIDWLESRYPGFPLVLTGFSFGAWVGLQVGCLDVRIKAMVGLGLPLNFYDFNFLIENPKPALYLIGTDDEFCPRDQGELFARRLPPTSTLCWIPHADHFFGRQLDQVQARIVGFFQALPLAQDGL
jgi:alpha/beta superfamily hydrolase